MGSNHVADTETPDMLPPSSKAFLDIHENSWVWIHSKTRAGHDNNIQLKSITIKNK